MRSEGEEKDGRNLFGTEKEKARNIVDGRLDGRFFCFFFLMRKRLEHEKCCLGKEKRKEMKRGREGRRQRGCGGRGREKEGERMMDSDTLSRER